MPGNIIGTDSAHFLFARIHEGQDSRVLQPGPGHFAVDLLPPGHRLLGVREAVERGALLEFARVVPPLSEVYREVTA